MGPVKKVSEMLGISHHTLRFYTGEGLIPNLRRDNQVLNFQCPDGENSGIMLRKNLFMVI